MDFSSLSGMSDSVEETGRNTDSSKIQVLLLKLLANLSIGC